MVNSIEKGQEKTTAEINEFFMMKEHVKGWFKYLLGNLVEVCSRMSPPFFCIMILQIKLIEVATVDKTGGSDNV